METAAVSVTAPYTDETSVLADMQPAGLAHVYAVQWDRDGLSKASSTPSKTLKLESRKRRRPSQTPIEKPYAKTVLWPWMILRPRPYNRPGVRSGHSTGDYLRRGSCRQHIATQDSSDSRLVQGGPSNEKMQWVEKNDYFNDQDVASIFENAVAGIESSIIESSVIGNHEVDLSGNTQVPLPS